MSARKSVEIVRDCSKDAVWYENHISEAVRDFYYANYSAETTEQIAKCGQNSFIAACTYARRQCIARDDLLCFVPHRVNSGTIAHNECYDRSKVDMICRIYLDLCFIFDKVPSVYGFSELTGIERSTLQEWVKGVSTAGRQDTPKSSVQKIQQARAESLTNVAISGGKGTVGAIACLNNSVWKERQEEASQMQVLSAADLPRLDISGNWQNLERTAEELPDMSGKGL